MILDFEGRYLSLINVIQPSVILLKTKFQKLVQAVSKIRMKVSRFEVLRKEGYLSPITGNNTWSKKTPAPSLETRKDENMLESNYMMAESLATSPFMKKQMDEGMKMVDSFLSLIPQMDSIPCKVKQVYDQVDKIKKRHNPEVQSEAER